MLMDMQMPRMDGLQVVEALNVEQLDIPVILMTAHGSENLVVEVFRKGVKDYVIKPFELDDMLQAIERSLVEVRLRKQKDELTEHLMVSNANLNQRAREIKVLHSIGKSVSGLMNAEGLMMRVVGAATMLTSSQEGGIFLMQGRRMMCQVLKSWDQQRPFPVNAPREDVLAARAIEAMQTIRFSAEEITTNPHDPFAATFSAAMAAPVMIADRCVGALVVKKIEPDGHAFGEDHAVLLGALSDYVAVALELSEHLATQPADADNGEQEQRTIFISYSRSDWDQYVSLLVDKLSAAGLTVWTAQHLAEGGQDWFDQTNEALANADYMVLCVTPDSMKDIYVRMEYRYFLREQKPLMMLICQEARLPQELLDTQHLPYGDVNILIEWLKRMVVAG
jgi:two-component system NtrC family sensor kinase